MWLSARIIIDRHNFSRLPHTFVYHSSISECIYHYPRIIKTYPILYLVSFMSFDSHVIHQCHVLHGETLSDMIIHVLWIDSSKNDNKFLLLTIIWFWYWPLFALWCCDKYGLFMKKWRGIFSLHMTIVIHFIGLLAYSKMK